MKLLRIILFPFVPVYALIIKIRNALFDKNIFKSRHVSANVVSVGNITVGGSGKTPFVIFLTNMLKRQGFKVGVLSRGYGRKTKGYLLVSKGEKILSTVDECGDEIYHTVLECKVPAAVCENRVEGANRFIKDAGINTIILDDAFQHRWIERDIDIVICEQRFLSGNNIMNNYLLPTGNMREPFNSLKRADAIVINRKFSDPEGIPVHLKKYFDNKKVFTASYRSIGFVDIKRDAYYAIEDFEGQKALVVSGVANPFSFINALKQTNVNTENQMIFKDHKEYTEKEVQNIRKEFYAANAHSVVTTEKDAVKLTKFSKELDDLDIFYLKIKMVLDDEKSFITYLNNKLQKQ